MVKTPRLAPALLALAGLASAAATPITDPGAVGILGRGAGLPGPSTPAAPPPPAPTFRVEVVRAGQLELPGSAAAMTEADAARILRACGYFRPGLVDYHRTRGATTPLEAALMALSWGTTYRRPQGPVALDPALKEAVLAQGRAMNAARARWDRLPEVSATATPLAMDRWLAEAGAVLVSLPEGDRVPLLRSIIDGETRAIHWKRFVPLIGYCGEIGLGQLMPRSAAALKVNAYDPRENLRGIATYIQTLMVRHRDLRKAIACYAAGNAPGPAAFAHADRVLARAARYRDAVPAAD